MSKEDSPPIQNDKKSNVSPASEKFPSASFESSTQLIQTASNVPVIREDLVTTAVNFLLNPKVIHNSLINKRTFLLKKGLTSDEIDVAIEKSFNQSSHYANSIIEPDQLTLHQPSFWQTTRSFASPFIFFSIAAYGSYFLYKKYLEPRLFTPKAKSTDQTQNEIETLTSAVESLEKSLQKMETEFQSNLEKYLISFSRPSPVECAAINDLKAEISSIKSLLLNKNQFPLTLFNKSSIPSWQLSEPTEEINNQNVPENGITE